MIKFVLFQLNLGVAIPNFPSENSKGNTGLKKVRAYYDYV
jgi:hypothetical protein